MQSFSCSSSNGGQQRQRETVQATVSKRARARHGDRRTPKRGGSSESQAGRCYRQVPKSPEIPHGPVKPIIIKYGGGAE